MTAFYLLSLALPCLMAVLAMVGTLIRAHALDRAATAPYEATPDDTWAVDLEWDLMTAPEAPCPVMARALDEGLVSAPWAVPTSWAAALDVPATWLQVNGGVSPRARMRE